MTTFVRKVGALIASLWLFSSIYSFGQTAPPAVPIAPAGRILNAWHFQTTNWQAMFGDVPLSFTNISLTPDWAGNGLLLDSDDPASLRYSVTGGRGRTNLVLNNGSLEFWFSPDWNSTDGLGNWGALLEAGTWETNLATASGAWGLYLSPDGSDLYFSAQGNGVMTNYLNVPVSWNAGEWHHVAVTYSPSNSALYLEGELVADGPGMTITPDIGALTNGFSIGSDGSGTGLLQARGVFNQLITYDYQLDAATISNNYAFDSEFVYPLPGLTGGSKTRTTDTLTPPPPPGDPGTNSPSLDFYSPSYASNDFYLEAVAGTNFCSCDPYVNLVLHGTTNGRYYELLSSTNLVQPIVWAPEQGIVGASGNSTSFQVNSKNRPTLFLAARTSSGVEIITQPLSQEVTTYDNVTFGVEVAGPGTLSYQWTLNGTNIPEATNSIFTISKVQFDDNGDYAAVISNGTNSVTSSNAVLTVDETLALSRHPATYNLIVVTGPRKDYTFKGGMTYCVSSPVQLYGKTTIEPGAVIKFAGIFESTLQIKGSLDCKAEAYNPAILTSIDDDFLGDIIYWGSMHYPVAATNGVPYLDLSSISCASIQNLRISFADQGIALPQKSFDAWDCQFLACYSATIAGEGTTASFHNILFANCGNAIQTLTNTAAFNGEHVTASVSNFWSGPVAPDAINLTNSIIFGTLTTGGAISTNHVALNPSGAVFQIAGNGSYYLAGSSYRHLGTTNVSPRLLAEFENKTTQPPVALQPFMAIDYNLTLFPQASRYTNGAPDLGFWYDALDYAVPTAGITNNATVTIKPGTAIAVRNAYTGSTLGWTFIGFDVSQGCSFISYGTSDHPNIFTAERMVQETPQPDFTVVEIGDADDWWQTISFLPDYVPVDSVTPPPVLDFRFSKFYLPRSDYHIWAGESEFTDTKDASDASAVYLTLQDCSIYGGRINLGEPAFWFPSDYIFTNGVVLWVNNLFDNVSVNIDPTLYEFGLNTNGLNVDLSFTAYNNLFRGGWLFSLQPIPASSGNWTLKNNVFEKVTFEQDSLGAGLPLDFDYNAYLKLSFLEYPQGYFFASNSLLPTVTGDGTVDGLHDITLTAPLPYQTGPMGNFYLPTNSPLFGAGSTTADQVGLFHYTTRTNQMKETNATVSIGLHYPSLASGQVRDSDGDGVPDYIEDANGNGLFDYNETDWTTNKTDGVSIDTTNVFYDAVDLDGDGLPGAAEKVFGTNPLVKDSPLDLNGLSNVVSGIVRIPLGISTNLTNVAPLFMTLNGLVADANFFQTNGSWVAEWDTRWATNGFYAVALEFPIDENGNTVQTSTKFVTIQNKICFAHDAPIAGSSLFLNPLTIYTNGTWAIYIRDDQGNVFTNITGNVDTNGCFIDSNTGQDGVSVSLLDTNGNQLPSQFYNVEMKQFAPGGGTAQADTTNTITVKKGIMGSKWAIAYMPLFPSGTANAANVASMMQYPVDAVVDHGAPTYNMNSIVDAPVTSDGNFPYAISNSFAYWSQLQSDLANMDVANFYYFGHFNGENIGGTYDPNLSIDVPTLATLLGNIGPTNAVYPPHPYRFVFIDGCISAKNKKMCEAFGIPPATGMTSSNMVAKGLSPCAYVGWKNYKLLSAANTFNADHVKYIANFWILWSSTTDPNTGQPYTLKDALRYADGTNSLGKPLNYYYKDVVIYGCEDLLFK